MTKRTPTVPVKPHGLLWAIAAVLAALLFIVALFVLVFYLE